MSPRSYTDDQVAFIRAKAPDHTDPQIARLMGWPTWKVLHVRTRQKIPTMPKDRFWTDERADVVRRRYIEGGESSEVVAQAIGCESSTVRRFATKKGWARNPDIVAGQRRENLIKAGAKARAARWAVKPTPAPAATSQPAPVQSRRHFGNSAFSYREPVEHEPLGDRILRALAERPLSAASLATVTGDKEAYVSMQLAALSHEGRVWAEEGPLRHKRWSMAHS
jgi:hypothetical protein